jgi:hypothetical protein
MESSPSNAYPASTQGSPTTIPSVTVSPAMPPAEAHPPTPNIPSIGTLAPGTPLMQNASSPATFDSTRSSLRMSPRTPSVQIKRLRSQTVNTMPLDFIAEGIAARQPPSTYGSPTMNSLRILPPPQVALADHPAGRFRSPSSPPARFVHVVTRRRPVNSIVQRAAYR